MIDHALVQASVQDSQAPVEVVVLDEQILQDDAVGIAQRHPQGVAQAVKLAPDVPAQRVEDSLAVEALDEAVKDAPAVHTEDVGDHPADACAAAVHHLADTITHPAALRDQGPTIAAERAQLAQFAGGHEARGA